MDGIRRTDSSGGGSVRDHREHIKELEAQLLAKASLLDKDPETEQEKKQTASDLESVEEEMGGGMRPMLHELTNKAFPKWTKKITDFYYRNLTLSYDVIHPYPLMNKHKSKDPVGKTLLILDSSFNPPTKAHAELVHMAIAKYVDPKARDTAVNRADYSTEQEYKRAVVLRQTGQEKNHGVPDVLLLLAMTNMEKTSSGFPTHAQKMIMMYALAYRIRRDKRYDRKSSSHMLLAPQIDLGITRFGLFLRKHIGITEYYGQYYDRRIWIMGSDTIFRIFDPSFYAKPEDMEEIYSTIMSPQDRVMVVLRASEKFGTIEEQHQKIREFDPRAIERLDIVESLEETENISSTLVRESLARGGTSWKQMIDTNVARFAILQGFYAPEVKKGTPNCPKVMLRLGNEVSRKIRVRSWLKEYGIDINQGRFGYEVEQHNMPKVNQVESQEGEEGQQDQNEEQRNLSRHEEISEADGNESIAESESFRKHGDTSEFEPFAEEEGEVLEEVKQQERLEEDEKKIEKNEEKQDGKANDESIDSRKPSTSKSSQLEEKEVLMKVMEGKKGGNNKDNKDKKNKKNKKKLTKQQGREEGDKSDNSTKPSILESSESDEKPIIKDIKKDKPFSEDKKKKKKKKQVEKVENKSDKSSESSSPEVSSSDNEMVDQATKDKASDQGKETEKSIPTTSDLSGFKNQAKSKAKQQGKNKKEIEAKKGSKMQSKEKELMEKETEQKRSKRVVENRSPHESSSDSSQKSSPEEGKGGQSNKKNNAKQFVVDPIDPELEELLNKKSTG